MSDIYDNTEHLGNQVLSYRLDNELGYFFYRGFLFAAAVFLFLIAYPVVSNDIQLNLERLLFLAPFMLLWISGFFFVKQTFEFDLGTEKGRYVLSVYGLPIISLTQFRFSEIAGVTVGGSFEDLNNTLRNAEAKDQELAWCYALFVVLNNGKVHRITGYNGDFELESKQAQELSEILRVHYMPAKPETLPAIHPDFFADADKPPTNVGRQSLYQSLWFRYMLEVLVFGVPFYTMLQYVGVL